MDLGSTVINSVLDFSCVTLLVAPPGRCGQFVGDLRAVVVPRTGGPGGAGCAGKHPQLLPSQPRRACAVLRTLSVRQLVPVFSSPRCCSESDSQAGKHLTEFKINSAMLVYFDENFLIIFLCLSRV